jgi:hypothetical protein
MQHSVFMDLAEYLLEVGATYERSEGLSSHVQNLLRDAPAHLAEHVPAGMFLVGSGGKGMATYTPWVGFFNPDETSSPQRGIYVVYIFAEDHEAVALTLNQGMEELRSAHGNAAARHLLARDAQAIRDGMPTASIAKWSDPINLRSSGSRQRAYEAGNIACRMYEVGGLPPEATLRADLSEMLGLYDLAVKTKRQLLLSAPGKVASSGNAQVTPGTDVLAGFKPKDAGDYLATLRGQSLVKSRRHERLLADFARFAASRGYIPTTEHPQDAVLRADGRTWIVEAKVIYNGHATEAVRAALGQLLAYAYFLHGSDQRPQLLALFNEPVGAAYVEFLESAGVASVWWSEGGWYGSPSATLAGLVD